jgi:hypothetical protein
VGEECVDTLLQLRKTLVSRKKEGWAQASQFTAEKNGQLAASTQGSSVLVLQLSDVQQVNYVHLPI